MTAPAKREMGPPTKERRTRFGAYVSGEELGRGSCSVVYRGHAADPTDERRVAIKVLASHLYTDARFRRRFLEQAAALASIDHPHVCRVFDHGDDGRRAYMVMEFLEGAPLSELLQRVPCPEPAAFEIVCAFCEGIDAVLSAMPDPASSGRPEITPRSLFVLDDGRPCVADLGLPVPLGEFSRTGVTLMQLPYMAPEQLLNRESDVRSSVWSLGVILWELLRGRSLFSSGNELKTMRAVLASPIDFSGLDEAVDIELRAALCREPIGRFASLKELAKTLTGLGAGRGGQRAVSGWLRLLAFEASEPDPPTRPLDTRAKPSRAAVVSRNPSGATSNTAVAGLTTEPGLVPALPLQPPPTYVPTAVAHPALLPGAAPIPMTRFGWLRFVVMVVASAVLVVLIGMALGMVPGTFHAEPQPSTNSGADVTSELLPNAAASVASGASSSPAATRTQPREGHVASESDTPRAVPSPESESAETSAADLSKPESVDKGPQARPVSPPSTRGEPKETSGDLGTGDVLIDTKRPGVLVYLDERLLGATPLRTRLPAGAVTVSLALDAASARVSTPLIVKPGRLNMFRLELE